MESTFSSRKNARIEANQNAVTEEQVAVLNCALNCIYFSLFNGVPAACEFATAGRTGFTETQDGAGDCTNDACDHNEG